LPTRVTAFSEIPHIIGSHLELLLKSRIARNGLRCQI